MDNDHFPESKPESAREPSSVSKEAFLTAFQDHSDAIFRFCLFRIGDNERALDLTQETFMKTWKYIRGENKHIKNLRAFLYTTANNLVVDEYRKRRSHISLEILEEETGFEPSAEEYDSIINKLDGKDAIALLKEMPEPYGQVLMLRFVEGLSLSEISEITGDSENTIAVRVHRAITKLQKLFNHE